MTKVLQDKYGFDDFNQKVFAEGGRGVGKFLWFAGDRGLIDRDGRGGETEVDVACGRGCFVVADVVG